MYVLLICFSKAHILYLKHRLNFTLCVVLKQTSVVFKDTGHFTLTCLRLQEVCVCTFHFSSHMQIAQFTQLVNIDQKLKRVKRVDSSGDKWRRSQMFLRLWCAVLAGVRAAGGGESTAG